jgi:cellulose synthase/poly-beta-1,6-N-acetylglucosamine synthase-like glycosyltransferase
MALFLMLLGAASLWTALHPFTTYPLSLLLLRRLSIGKKSAWKWKAASSEVTPGDIAVCMCAYNEERVIGAKIANLLQLRRAYPGLEIFVYVDGATDGTAELLRAYEPEIRLVVATERRGKTHGMNRLVSLVDKPIVMFTDANVQVDVAAPGRLMRYFADPNVGCVCGHLRYTNSGASVTADSGSRYWRLEESIKRLESDTGSSICADGSLFAIRRALHRPPPDDLIDDMYVSLMVLCEGYRVVQADDVIAYEKSVTASGEEFSRKVRIACQAFNVHRVLWSRVRRTGALSVYKYVSHKWIRWLSVFFMFGGALSLLLGSMLAGRYLLAVVGSTLAALAAFYGALSRSGPFAQAWDIFAAFAGTGVGVIRSIRGDRFQTWTPAASIRDAATIAAATAPQLGADLRDV